MKSKPYTNKILYPSEWEKIKTNTLILRLSGEKYKKEWTFNVIEDTKNQ